MKQRWWVCYLLAFGISFSLFGGHTLTFEERVEAQGAIERVYYNLRIWPNESPKPSFEEMVPEEVIRKKVEDYLLKSVALEEYWQRPLTGEQLQAEMDRMAGRSKKPEILKEIFTALKNDPRVIAECLARPVLVNRLIRNWYSHDERFHGELKKKVMAFKENLTPDNFAFLEEGEYHEVHLKLSNEHFPSPEDLEITYLPEEDFKKESAEFPDSSEAVAFEETREAIIFKSTIHKSENELDGAVRVFRKVPFDEWFEEVKDSLDFFSMNFPDPPEGYYLPQVRSVSGEFLPDSWLNADTNPPSRRQHTAVWTGTNMIIWGGFGVGWTLLNTGDIYNPIFDTLTPTSTNNAPLGRRWHTAVWTGTEMIIWGGGIEGSTTNTGGRYNPSTNSWASTSTSGVPDIRYLHTAVWTDTEMIVWGGTDGISIYHDTGGRYNPTTDTWIATSTTNAPWPRVYHTTVWTGSEIIVWGGEGASDIYYLNSGGRYNPATDIWSPTSTTNAPLARKFHTSVWTETEMIIWGGEGNGSNYPTTGGRYNPTTDSWIATSITNTPTGRGFATAIWTGIEMIVWGGFYYDGGLNQHYPNGGRYNPALDNWQPTPLVQSPQGRDQHTAVWTGDEMIVSGGEPNNSLGIYFPNTPPSSYPDILNPGDTITLGSNDILQLSHMFPDGSQPTTWWDDVEGSIQWQATGGWHVVANQNCSGVRDYFSPIRAWYMGDSSTCTNGIGIDGSLTSQDNFNVTQKKYLTFRYLLKSFSDPFVGDIVKVQLLDGVSWKVVAIDNHHSGSYSGAIPLEDTKFEWRAVSIKLTDYVSGTTTKVRFSYNIVNPNIFLGWLVDDIGIGELAGDGSNPYSTIPYHDKWDQATYEWDLNNDGVADNPDPNTPIWNIPESDLGNYGLDFPGDHIFTLKVTDLKGLTISNPVILHVLDSIPPQVSVISPNGGESWAYSESSGNRQNHLIVWQSSDNFGISRIKLSYSSDGGANLGMHSGQLGLRMPSEWAIPRCHFLSLGPCPP